MDRKTVLLDEAQLERQREYTRQLAALHQQRGKPVYALVDTFGCQQNVADSQHILGMLRDMGCQFTDDAAQADIVVLNTCAIRDHAEKRVYGNLGALTHTKKQNPEQVICLCGCMAQRPEVAEKVRQSYRHVDLVFGPQALWKFPELLYRVYTRRGRVFSVEDEHGTIAEGMPVVREGNVRAWVSIMYGCRLRMNSRSFCATKDKICSTRSAMKVPIRSLPCRVSSSGIATLSAIVCHTSCWVPTYTAPITYSASNPSFIGRSGIPCSFCHMVRSVLIRLV